MEKVNYLQENYLEMIETCETVDSCSTSDSSHASTFQNESLRTSKVMFFGALQLSPKTDTLDTNLVKCSAAETVAVDDAFRYPWTDNCSFVLQEELTPSADRKLELTTETVEVSNCSDISLNVTNSSDVSSDNHLCFDSLSYSDVLSHCDDMSCLDASTNTSGFESLGTATNQNFESLGTATNQNCHPSSRYRNISDLLPMDICSLVGQRYLQYQNTFPVFRDEGPISYEAHCEGPVLDDIHWLRPRQEPYPITYKKDLEVEEYAHIYKFSVAERSKYMRKLGFWLSLRSQKLLHQMKPCVVRLNFISARTFQKFRSKQQPVVCINPLSLCLIKKWTKQRLSRKSVHQKKPHKNRRKLSCPAIVERSRRSLRNPVVRLTRCDFNQTKLFTKFESRKAVRYSLSCLNQNGRFISHNFAFMPTIHGLEVHRNNKVCSQVWSYRNIFKRTAVIKEISYVVRRIQVTDFISNQSVFRCIQPSERVQSDVLPASVTASNCTVLLRDIQTELKSKKNLPGFQIAKQKTKNAKPMQKWTDRCFVSLSDCNRKMPISNVYGGQKKRSESWKLGKRSYRDHGWKLLKENRNSATDVNSSASVLKQIKMNSSCIRLFRCRKNNDLATGLHQR